MPIDGHHLDPPAIEHHHVADLRQISHPSHHEPGECLVGTLGNTESGGLLYLVKVEATRHHSAALRFGAGTHFDAVGLVADLAQYLLKDVLEGDDPRRAAVLVDDHR